MDMINIYRAIHRNREREGKNDARTQGGILG